MLLIEYRELSWWYWLLIASCLLAGVTAWPEGVLFALGVAAIQLVHFFVLEHSIVVFQVQVRLGYFLVLLGLMEIAEDMQWLFWLPTIGTWSTVLFGYSLLDRIISLLPWNSREALSLNILKRTFFTTPARWNIWQGLPPA